jgi:hypothetical protein
VGRRSRARRATTVAPPARPGGLGDSPGWGLLHKLNPIKTPPTRARVRIAAAAFAVGAVVMGVAAWATGQRSWFNPAVSLAILAVVWGLFALTMRGGDRSG